MVLGTSPERLLICPFFAFGLTLSDRLAGLKFLIGRIIGIVLLGLVIAIIGLPFKFSAGLLDLILGISLIVTGTIIYFAPEKHGHRKGVSNAGFGLGLYRGLLNPDRLIILLVPLLWGVSLVQAGVISLVYAISSSIYLLIGFISASVLRKLIKHEKAIRITGSVIIILLGLFYIGLAITGGI